MLTVITNAEVFQIAQKKLCTPKFTISQQVKHFGKKEHLMLPDGVSMVSCA